MTGQRTEKNKLAQVRVWLGLAGWLLVVFTAAAVGGMFRPGEWYASLIKPSWNPPNWIFGPVWTLLYVFMALSAWLVWREGGFVARRLPLLLFLVQLLFNAAWSPLFFGLRKPGLAFIDIVLLWIALLITAVFFWKARRAAGALLIPYLAWVTFAAALNFTLWRLNS